MSNKFFVIHVFQSTDSTCGISSFGIRFEGKLADGTTLITRWQIVRKRSWTTYRAVLLYFFFFFFFFLERILWTQSRACTTRRNFYWKQKVLEAVLSAKIIVLIDKKKKENEIFSNLIVRSHGAITRYAKRNYRSKSGKCGITVFAGADNVGWKFFRSTSATLIKADDFNLFRSNSLNYHAIEIKI